ncbi:MAG: GlcNAc-PI de-N-acetylase [Syntrophus sp. (in: bacteria)]|nr:GlcNAc-PI de-N-acetylase [Syntrophus sp. (in: bacteria)]
MDDILVLAVHPDDETLGAGGTILRHKAEGQRIHWLIVTAMYYRDQEGLPVTISHKGDITLLPEGCRLPTNAPLFDKKFVEQRVQEIMCVSQAYNFDSITELFVPTATVGDQDEIDLMTKASKEVERIRPNTVYLPFYGDIHGDHRAVFLTLYSCVKSFRYPFVKNVYMMETISETEYALPGLNLQFTPNRFMCIDEWFEKKISICKIFASEMGRHPMPRSEECIRSQALIRGSFAQCRYAEAFMVVREIV